MYVALLAYAAFTAPHVLYHALHPADLLTGPEDLLNVATLASGLVLAAVFAIGSSDRWERGDAAIRTDVRQADPVGRL
jgi:hypothetical protein